MIDCGFLHFSSGGEPARATPTLEAAGVPSADVPLVACCMNDSRAESQDLSARLKGGDKQAVAELFSRHRERLWRTVNFRLDRRLAGRVDADDVLQEAYLDAAQRVRHYAEASMSPFVWVRMIVAQTMIDVHRRHLGVQKRDANREKSIQGGGYSQTTAVSLAAQLLGHFTSPSHALMRGEMAQQLEAALETMDPIDQEVLALRHFEELTNSEVAEVLGIQQKAASIRYVRAIARLKDILSQLPFFSDQSRR
jgi:RNA polymerase sigma-70 factor (ECF subfamily)